MNKSVHFLCRHKNLPTIDSLPLYPKGAKKTNQKKGHQSFAPLSAGFPVLLDPAGSLKTRFAQTVQTPFSAVSAVLGCMTME
jgi:hypothetical protein